MLIVKPLDVTNDQTLYFHLIDAHHHIGEDVDGNKNVLPRGSFEFFSSIWTLLKQRYVNIDSAKDYFYPYMKISDIQPPSFLKFVDSDQKYQSSWIFDQFVAFPFHDKNSRIDANTANYSYSNNRISKLTMDPSSLSRLIGYCRIDINDGEKAISELDRCIQELNLQGIKLHPLSDNWNSKDSFFDPQQILKRILLRAFEYNLPVIFDCRFQTTLEWIYSTVDEVRSTLLERKYPEAQIDHQLKVVVAHIGFLWQEGALLAKVLSHPNIYGDLTGQFSDKTRALITYLKEKVQCQSHSFNDALIPFY